MAALRALAALLRLRDRVDLGDVPTQVIDFSGLESIAGLRDAAISLNAAIDATLAGEPR